MTLYQLTVTIFVEETNKHCSRYLDALDNDDRCSKLYGVSMGDVCHRA